jgi:hypothetical protein
LPWRASRSAHQSPIVEEETEEAIGQNDNNVFFPKRHYLPAITDGGKEDLGRNPLLPSHSNRWSILVRDTANFNSADS